MYTPISSDLEPISHWERNAREPNVFLLAEARAEDQEAVEQMHS
jgi:hypothetical protein